MKVQRKDKDGYVDYVFLPPDVFCCLVMSSGKEEMKNSRIQRRVYELLSKAPASASSQPMSRQRELHFVFFRKPDSFLESNERSGHVSGVHFEKTALKGNSLSSLKASLALCC